MSKKLRNINTVLIKNKLKTLNLRRREKRDANKN